jgi:integrase
LNQLVTATQDDISEGLEKKISYVTQSFSQNFLKNKLKNLARKNPDNANVICEYIIVEQTEFNIKDSTKMGKIKALVYLSNHLQDTKLFKEMRKQDILDHLNTFRNISNNKNNNSNNYIDNKWIGTYNFRRMIFSKFFKWLYNPDEPISKNRQTPPCMIGIKKLPRKIQSRYNPSDIWDSREHSIFLKYCPFKRDKCYHAIANDTSARPHELLNLRIKDVKFHLTEEGKQYAIVRITDGKTGARTVPLFHSIPYLKEWIQQEHPTGSNPDSWLFVTIGKKQHCSKLSHQGLVNRYDYYKKKYFHTLLANPSIPAPDKSWIKNMLTKPWNLYIFRHSSLTEKSKIVTEAVLRKHAGWTMSSEMPQIYIHLQDESSNIILEKYGFKNSKNSQQELSNVLMTKECPNCFEPNKPDGSKFCIKCKMVLSYDEYNETIEGKQRRENEILKLKSDYENDMQTLREEMNQKFNNILSLINDNPKLVNVKRDILEKII